MGARLPRLSLYAVGIHKKTAALTSGLKCTFVYNFLSRCPSVKDKKGGDCLEFSVDMIRISTRVSVADFSTFYQMISFNPEIHSYIGRGLSEYHYNFSVA